MENVVALHTFQPKLEKTEKHPEKNSYIFFPKNLTQNKFLFSMNQIIKMFYTQIVFISYNLENFFFTHPL